MNYKEFKTILQSYITENWEEEVIDEASWNPVTKKIQDKPASREEIESLAAKARTKKKPRNPVGTTRKSNSSFKPSSPEKAKADKAAWDDYWSVAARGYKEEFAINTLDERKYSPDEKLPSGKTPVEKMERAQSKQGANYLLSKGSLRHSGAKKSYWNRGNKIKIIKDIVKKGGDPRNDPDVGPGWGHDARKINRPGASVEDRTSKTTRTDDHDARTAYTQGGLRAHKTKAGGYRKVTRKNSNDR